MTIDLKEVPSIYGPRPADSRRINRAGPLLSELTRGSRRAFLASAGVASAWVGLSVVGLLPPARRAWATHKLPDATFYNWDTNGCPGFSWYSNHGETCAEACGDSDIHPNACFDTGTWAGYHRDHSSGSGTEWSLRPDECPKSTADDGWRWKVPSPCNSLEGPTCNNNSLHRCHDGYHNHGTGSNPDWVNSICRKKMSCDVSGSN